MIQWKKWLKIFYIVPVIFLFNIYELISDINNIPVSSMLINKVYGQITIGDKKTFVLVMGQLFFLFLFNLLYGNYIYEDFRICSCYIFSRLKNRKGWYYKKNLELLVISIMYTFLLLTTYVIICVVRTGNHPDLDTLRTFMLLLYMLSIILFASTVCINLISVNLGNTFGFVIIYTVEILLVLLSIQYHTIPFLHNNDLLQKLNPFCGIIISFPENYRLQIFILIYYLLFIILSLWIGGIYITKVDIALVDYEKQ